MTLWLAARRPLDLGLAAAAASASASASASAAAPVEQLGVEESLVLLPLWWMCSSTVPRVTMRTTRT